MSKSVSKSKAWGSNPTTAASGPSEPTTDLNPDTGNNEVSFHSLTMLLTLATAVNNDGHPTLSKKLNGEFHQTHDTPQQNRAIAMDAVGCILVWDWEVIAVAGCDPEYKHDDWSAQGKIDIHQQTYKKLFGACTSLYQLVPAGTSPKSWESCKSESQVEKSTSDI